jgi:hypothetical protein
VHKHQRALHFRAIAGVFTLGFLLVACGQDAPTELQQPALSVSRASGCGFDQLRERAPQLGGAARAGSNSLSDPVGVPISGVTVYANFPKQWRGTYGAMSWGTIYVLGYNGPQEPCTTNGGTTFGEAEELVLRADSTAAETPPDGVDPIEWRRLPVAVRRLIRDLAQKLVQQTPSCQVPVLGEVSCVVIQS